MYRLLFALAAGLAAGGGIRLLATPYLDSACF
jgi:hypothetical protein